MIMFYNYLGDTLDSGPYYMWVEVLDSSTFSPWLDLTILPSTFQYDVLVLQYSSSKHLMFLYCPFDSKLSPIHSSLHFC